MDYNFGWTSDEEMAAELINELSPVMVLKYMSIGLLTSHEQNIERLESELEDAEFHMGIAVKERDFPRLRQLSVNAEVTRNRLRAVSEKRDELLVQVKDMGWL